MNRPAPLLLALLLLPLAACGDEEASIDAPSGDNAAPVAVIAPVGSARAGDPVLIDASMSFDEDGEVVGYIFDFDDGSPFFETASPRQYHTYSAPGRYQVVVTVVDDQGTKGSEEVAVTVE